MLSIWIIGADLCPRHLEKWMGANIGLLLIENCSAVPIKRLGLFFLFWFLRQNRRNLTLTLKVPWHCYRVPQEALAWKRFQSRWRRCGCSPVSGREALWLTEHPRWYPVQLLSHVQFFAAPWTAPHQASLSITNFRSLLKLFHWVGDAIPPSHPLLSPSPLAYNLSQHQDLFKWVSSLH